MRPPLGLNPATLNPTQRAVLEAGYRELAREQRAERGRDRSRRPRGQLEAPRPPREELPTRALLEVAALPPRTAWPTLVIPFRALVSDNAKMQPTWRRTAEGGRRPHLELSDRYRRAKGAVAALAMKEWAVDGARLAPAEGELELLAVLFEPNRAAEDGTGRDRDPGNFRKLVTDALQGTCYADDAQLCRETWERGGVDRRNPRLELQLRPFVSRARLEAEPTLARWLPGGSVR